MEDVFKNDLKIAIKLVFIYPFLNKDVAAW